MRITSVIRQSQFVIIAILFWGCSATSQLQQQFDPVAVFLTWKDDPTTSMVVDWHTTPDDGQRLPELQYRVNDTGNWMSARVASHEFPYSERMIHRVELTGLAPGTEYQFRFGEDSKSYKFRTMPANNNEPIRFVVGGDVRDGSGVNEDYRRMNRVAMKYDPEFIMWGGDLAYANGRPDFVDRWHDFFDGQKETLVTGDGRVVPIINAIAGHEIFDAGRIDDETERNTYMEKYGLEAYQATFFFDVFAFPPRPGYGALHAGDYLTILVLANNTNVDLVEQARWMKPLLEKRKDVPHIFPIYHAPSYPSIRGWRSNAARQMREYWAPLWEEYGVRVAFENHDHAYKRTYPIRNEKIHPDGVVYIGDGRWGSGGRGDILSRSNTPEEQKWYLHKTSLDRHGIVVTLHGPMMHMLMVNEFGEVIDEYPQSPK